MTVTVGGDRITYHSVRWWSWINHARARIDTATPNGAAVGDEVTLALNGTALFTGQVTSARLNYRHTQIDAVPSILVRLAEEQGPSLPDPNTPRAASEIADMLGISAYRFDGDTDRQLPRWSTRARLLGWQWESLMLNLAATWRYSPRDDRLVVEQDRAEWPQQDLAPLRRAGEFLIFAAADLQAGDRIEDAEIVSTESVWQRGDHGQRTKARIA